MLLVTEKYKKARIQLMRRSHMDEEFNFSKLLIINRTQV